MKNRGLIILGEDDTKMRRLYTDVLEGIGFSVLAAGDGVEVLGFLSRAKPRLIVLDIMMPNLDGIETCKRARNILMGDIPIIFLSSMDREDIFRQCLEAGGDDYLIKPISFPDFITRVDQWMQASRRQNLFERRKNLLANIPSS